MEYKKIMRGTESKLDEQKIGLLEKLGFKWEVMSDRRGNSGFGHSEDEDLISRSADFNSGNTSIENGKI